MNEIMYTKKQVEAMVLIAFKRGKECEKKETEKRINSIVPSTNISNRDNKPKMGSISSTIKLNALKQGGWHE